jgi:hypothetical protein
MSDYYTSDDETTYSSSDDDFYYCYYCEADLSFENDVFEDLEPCKPRYYCRSCKLHIHCDELESDDD